MSNILKSTKLDIALVKPYFKTICFTLLLPIVFAAINRSLLTGVSFAMCFIAMTTGYTFSITEKNSMDRLFGILPVRKSELVIGRYVFVLAMGLLFQTSGKAAPTNLCTLFSWHEQSRYCQSGRNTQKPDHPFYRSRIA